MKLLRRFPLLMVLFFVSGLVTAAQSVKKETLPGIRSFAQVDNLIACGGAITPEGFPELKRRGFKAVINLRRPSEPNADVEGEGEAARKAGLRYVNLPFNAAAPDAADSVEPFLKLMAIHRICRSLFTVCKPIGPPGCC